MAEKKDGKAVPLPLSMICSLDDDEVKALKTALERAHASLKEAVAAPEWVEYEKLMDQVENADEECSQSGKKIRKLKADRNRTSLEHEKLVGEAAVECSEWISNVRKLMVDHERMNSEIAVEEDQMEKMEEIRGNKKRALDEFSVPEEVMLNVEAALKNLEKAKKEYDVGNEKKAVRKRIEAALRMLNEKQDHRRFKFEEMVPVLAWELIGRYADMKYTIDSPDEKPEVDTALWKDAKKRLTYTVKKTGCSMHVFLEDRKDCILPIIHNLEGYHVYGMNAEGTKYTAGAVIRPMWEKEEDCQWMVQHCWVGNEGLSAPAPGVEVIVLSD